MKTVQSVHSTFMRYTLFITLAALGILGVVWGQAEYASFQQDANDMRRHYLADYKSLLQHEVAGVASYISYMSNRTTEQARRGIKQRVDEAYEIAQNIYLQNREKQTPAIIQKMIKDALRPIRFNNGRGYYFSFTLEGIEELFADRPELEGTNMLQVQGAEGEFVVRDMLALVKAQKEGFYDYTWSKPGHQDKVFHKTAYVKLFAPYNWVLGTGEYLDDTMHDIQEQVLQRVITLRFDEEGYFFGSTLKGDSLFSNGKITKGSGGSILGLTDPNGVKIIQEQIQAVQESPAGGFVHYSWKKLGRETPSPKLSFVIAIPKWQWVIGAGVYLDTIDEVLAQKKASLQKRLLGKFLKSIPIFF